MDIFSIVSIHIRHNTCQFYSTIRITFHINLRIADLYVFYCQTSIGKAYYDGCPFGTSINSGISDVQILNDCILYIAQQTGSRIFVIDRKITDSLIVAIESAFEVFHGFHVFSLMSHPLRYVNHFMR